MTDSPTPAQSDELDFLSALVAPKKSVCRVCDVEFTYEKGKRPTTCPNHRARTGRNAVSEKRAELVDHHKKEQARLAKHDPLNDPLMPMRFAVALRIRGNAKKAAEFLRLNLTPEELDELECRARSEADLLAGKSSATNDLITAAIQLSAIEALDRVKFISPRDLPNATRQLVQAKDIVNGGERTAEWSNIEVVFPGLPEGSNAR